MLEKQDQEKEENEGKFLNQEFNRGLKPRNAFKLVPARSITFHLWAFKK